jgi:hypothetical protein
MKSNFLTWAELGLRKGEIRTREGLSSLPVFKFQRIPSASIQAEQFRTIVSPSRAVLTASVHPLGGQGGGQPRARVDAPIKPTVSFLQRREGVRFEIKASRA